MQVGAEGKYLYTASSSVPQMLDYQPEQDGQAGIFRFDLATGNLHGRWLLSNKSGQHILGDLVVGKEGQVYASDSKENSIYYLDGAGDELTQFIAPGHFSSLQGLALSGDEQTLFAADYAQGVFKIDVADKKVERIAHSDTICTLGVDGLYSYQNSLIAIQNGIRPHRVVRLDLNDSRLAITRAVILEANHPDMEDPTLGVVVRDSFYFVANSQWGAFDKNGHILPEEQLDEPVILKTRLQR